MAGIPHTQFPYDESPWIMHFHNADDANQRAQIHAAASADYQGDDSLARHIMAAKLGVNPMATYKGPFGEGSHGRQFTPDMPSQLYSKYFGDYRPAGADQAGPGPYADPRKFTPAGAAGPVVTGNDYLLRMYQQGGSGISPAGSLGQK